MYKIFCSILILFSNSLLNAAATEVEDINDLKSPTVVAERASYYKFTPSVDIAKNVLSALSSIKNEKSSDPKAEDQFKTLLRRLIYPHLSKVSGAAAPCKGFREAVIELRSVLDASEGNLPFFFLSQY